MLTAPATATDLHSDSKKFRKYTPVAANFVPAADLAGVPSFTSREALGRIFVYYLYENDKHADILYRTHADLLPNNNHPSFLKDPVRVGKSDQRIQNQAQMSIVADPERRSNWVYAVKFGDGNKISAIQDEWAAGGK